MALADYIAYFRHAFLLSGPLVQVVAMLRPYSVGKLVVALLSMFATGGWVGSCLLSFI